MVPSSTTTNAPAKTGVIVTIAPDKLQATLDIPAGVAPTVSVADIENALFEQGVVFGIDQPTIQRLVGTRKVATRQAVAQGKIPMPGLDGQVALAFEDARDMTPQEDDKGNVDYRNVSMIQNVTNGDVLARLKPPGRGEPGKAVTGDDLPAEDGKPVVLPAGRNTAPHPDDPNVLVATTDGSVAVGGDGLVHVDSLYSVDGDVDFSTGNIDHIGSLHIAGDVKAGFTVKAGGDIDIDGVVEDATVEAGGNVMIRRGLVGKGQGLVTAGREVHLKYCENQKIRAGGDVIVGENLFNADVVTHAKVLLKGAKGAIIGGRVLATYGVEAKNIGNYQNQRTEVLVGIDEEKLKRLEELEKDLAACDDNNTKLKDAIYKLAMLKAERKRLSAEKQNLLTRMQHTRAKIPDVRSQLEAEQSAIEAAMVQLREATVCVRGTLYPGTRIQITNLKSVPRDELKFVAAKVSGAGIQYTKYTG